MHSYHAGLLALLNFLSRWLAVSPLDSSGDTIPGRVRSNDLAEELPPWLAPWLTKIVINLSNTIHKQINL